MPQTQQQVTSGVQHREVEADYAGQRLDNYLLRELGIPRAQVYKLIRTGQVRVNGGRCKPTRRLDLGDRLRIPPYQAAEPVLGGAPPAGAVAALCAAVIGEWAGLKIIDKRSGWASQGGTGIRFSLVELAAAAWGEQWHPAHRLDRPTSGCLAIVEGRPGMQAFAVGEWSKRYIALCHGQWQGAEQRWEDELPRVRDGDAGDSRYAASRVRCLEQGGELCLLEFYLETGRTHQIRLQAARRGYPLVGDDRYGERSLDKTLGSRPRLALHAAELSGHWRPTNTDIRAQAPLPDDLAQLMQQQGFSFDGL